MITIDQLMSEFHSLIVQPDLLGVAARKEKGKGNHYWSVSGAGLFLYHTSRARSLSPNRSIRS